MGVLVLLLCGVAFFVFRTSSESDGRKPLQAVTRLKGVSVGNAAEVGKTKGGWFVGNFIADDELRQTQDVEIKWGIHKSGESNGGFATNNRAKTMSVLIKGRFTLTFQRAVGSQTVEEDVPLTKEGDYALWTYGVPHNWKCLEECTILTVRWPSLPKDQSMAKP